MATARGLIDLTAFFAVFLPGLRPGLPLAADAFTPRVDLAAIFFFGRPALALTPRLAATFVLDFLEPLVIRLFVFRFGMLDPRL